MLAINLTADEMSALEGLPYIVICLYVMAIRPRMDYETRLVGIRPRISRQALAEWIYVDPLIASRRSGRPSIEQLRGSLRLLKSAGLIQQQYADRELIFFLPLARQGKSGQKTSYRDINRDCNRAKAAPDMDLDSTSNRDINRDSNPHQKQALKPKPTPPTPSVVVDLNFESTSIPPAQQLVIFSMLLQELQQGPGGYRQEDAQLLLDECTGQGRIRAIRNPQAYLRTLAKRFIAGQFTPELAGQIAAGRQKKQAEPEKPTVFIRRSPEELARLRAGLGLPRPDGPGKG